MGQGQVYFTFPIRIIVGATDDIRVATSNIMDYCGYECAVRLKGTIKEKMKESGIHLGLTWGDVERTYYNGEKLSKSIPLHSPMTSINKDIVFDFYKNDKTEFEAITFLAYAAIRSIIQSKPFVKVTNDYLLTRMAGYSKVSEIHIPNREDYPGLKDKNNLPPLFKKYSTRYQLDKIKLELQNHWGMKLYARHTRGFYVSFSMKDYSELVFEVEKRRKSNIERIRKEEQQKAIDKALNKLFRTSAP
ncbi:hypothetical protein HXX01_01855 [Candidatus Nomurabacteria bacterium]|nr:hypothetical protein [Candidatus Nomurabacteria bacterium]